MQSFGHHVFLSYRNSVLSALIRVHRRLKTAWHHPESLTIVLGPSERQGSELVRKAATFLTRLGVRPRGDGSNKSSLLLPNGARTRGFSGATLLIVDEASRVPEELYLAMRPILARSNGDVWLMSTPCGRRGFFFNTWLAKDRKIMSDRFFRQEYLREFTDNDETLFPSDLIDPAVDHDLKPLF